MQAAQALETALDRNMVAADDVNGAIEALIQIADRFPSTAIAEYLLGVAQRLRRVRGNVHEVNSILDDALYTVQGAGPNFEIRSRRK